MLLGDKTLRTTCLYLHLAEKNLSHLQSPFDLLRLPKPDDVPASPTVEPQQH